MFRSDERGVSPVLGVILLVAVTVVLAGVVGSALFGTAGEMSSDRPDVRLTFDPSGPGNVTMTHAGGERLESSRVTETDSLGCSCGRTVLT